MDAYERKVIRRIYEAACMGDRKALRILENLTTKRRRIGTCRKCGNPLHRKKNTYCSQSCANSFPGRIKKPSFGPKPTLSPDQIHAIQQEYIASNGSHKGNARMLAAKYGVARRVIRWWANKVRPKPARKPRTGLGFKRHLSYDMG